MLMILILIWEVEAGLLSWRRQHLMIWMTHQEALLPHPCQALQPQMPWVIVLLLVVLLLLVLVALVQQQQLMRLLVVRGQALPLLLLMPERGMLLMVTVQVPGTTRLAVLHCHSAVTSTQPAVTGPLSQHPLVASQQSLQPQAS